MSNGKIDRFRENLARALDDNMHTRQWHNVVDWLIISLILISTAEIFLSTFDISPGLRRVLWWVDGVCLVFFIIEVTARIWVAPIIDPRFSGWKGRLRYCFTFHGFIDVISTYPFVLGFIFPLPFAAIRTLRMARVLRLARLTRYSKSFDLFNGALLEKRHELMISLQFLVIITIILSLLLFFFEHEAQPDVYDNGFASVAWAFAQYIGDPGGFADTPPVTFWGRAIACLVGVLGIAIVAVPAGIIGAGFTEAIENVRREDELEENREKILCAFERKLDRPTGYQIVLPYRTVIELQARMGLKADEIIDACERDPSLRLINLAATIPSKYNPIDRLAVEHVAVNTDYGCCIDRGSNVTIISPSGLLDPCTSIFAYYVAKIGGFNFVSREIGERAPYKSYYAFALTAPRDQAMQAYLDDVERFLSRPKAWGITFNISSGALEPEYDTQMHIALGGPKGDTALENHSLVRDMDVYRRFYSELVEVMKRDFDIAVDQQKYHSSDSRNIYLRHLTLPEETNNIILRIEWNRILWDPRRMLLAKELAELISLTIAGKPAPDDPTMFKKDIGFRGY